MRLVLYRIWVQVSFSSSFQVLAYVFLKACYGRCKVETPASRFSPQGVQGLVHDLQVTFGTGPV